MTSPHSNSLHHPLKLMTTLIPGDPGTQHTLLHTHTHTHTHSVNTYSRGAFVSSCALYLRSPPSGSRGWASRARSSRPRCSPGRTRSGFPRCTPRACCTCPGTAARCTRCPVPRSGGSCHSSRSPGTSGSAPTWGTEWGKMKHALQSDAWVAFHRLNGVIWSRETN